MGHTVWVSNLAFIAGFLGTTLITQGWMLLVLMTFFSIGGGLSRPLLLGNISKSVSSQEQGAVLGVAKTLC